MKRLFFFLTLFLSLELAAQDPINLITPFDEDTICNYHPTFAWSILGSPVFSNERDYYQIVVVALNEGQNASAGILSNTPLLRVDHLTSTQQFYPYDAPALEDGKSYAWQVQKVENNQVVSTSEAWKFTLCTPPVLSPVYHKLKYGWDGVYYELQNGTLYFELKEPYKENSLTYSLYNSKNEKVSSVVKQKTNDYEPAITNAKKTGVNKYALTLNESLPIGIYRLEVVDAKRNKYEIHFNVQ
ncbi:MAG: hypothetical protein RL264_2227 [Bacteroidota bacterium]|jgi:hypothetical protein